MRAEGVGEFEAHVAESAEADDADFFSGADVPVAERGVGGDSGAEERGDGGEVEVGGDGVCEALVDDVVAGVAAHGDGAVDAIFGCVGEGGAFSAEMFFSAVTGRAVAAGIDDDADCGNVSGLKLFGRVPSSDYTADDFVAGDHGVDGLTPLVAGHVEVGVADSAIENFDSDLGGAGFAAAEAVRCERRPGICGGITFG